MSRTLLAPLIVSVLVLGASSAAAAAPTPANTETVAAASNPSPLPPGGAAGIKEAQGIEGGSYWLEAGLVIGAFVILWILTDGDDSDEATTTTGP